ncbi:helix-turn-helix transcriptional regulator [Streptomyces sp. 09ZI22]|uniref:helix-turn-helix transcriptional regulator n=1 Tax=Streptomyces sp. 09ZI22 TaxID=2856603 RepID=UPI001C55F6E3|nr:helix-turn-helix transcriptional regulator [Streptomyces sp. 09ZI22]MBW3361773.1 helix-turn-helix transcriptional regulator [Streptomyces sp. 09ZI22]
MSLGTNLTAPPHRNPLRGRTVEAATVEALIRHTHRGTSSLLTVEAPPGMGKSRLLAEAGQIAQRLGAEVIDSLRAPVSPLRTPALVLLDNAHRLPADAGSALAGLRAQLTDRPVLWLLSRTPGADLTQTDIALCGATDFQERLILGPLSEPAARLLASDVRSGLPGLTARQVEEAGGHPATLLALAAHQDRAESGCAVSPGHPSALKHLVDGLLQACSPACRRTVRVAAVFGRHISFDDLISVTDYSPVTLLKHFDEMTAAGLERCHEAGYAFASHLFWQAVRDTVPDQVQEIVLRQATPRKPAARYTGSGAGHPAAVPHQRSSADTAREPRPRSRAARPAMDESDGGERWPALTAQQQIIATLAADGLTNRQIGERIFLSPHTVNYHLRKVYGALQVASRIELSRIVHLALGAVEAGR